MRFLLRPVSETSADIPESFNNNVPTADPTVTEEPSVDEIGSSSTAVRHCQPERVPDAAPENSSGIYIQF